MARFIGHRDFARELRPRKLLPGLPESGTLDSDGVHRVRRTVKHARSILRLAHNAGVAGADEVRRKLGDAARRLGPLRDATVAARVAEKLGERVRGSARAAADSLAGIPSPNRASRWWADTWRSFARAKAMLSTLDSGALTGASLEHALRISVRRVCKRARRIGRKIDIEKLHAWRKAVIELREQVLFSRGVLGSRTDRLHSDLVELGRQLGRAVDTDVFLQSLRGRKRLETDRKSLRRLAARAEKAQARAAKHACRRWRKLRATLRHIPTRADNG